MAILSGDYEPQLDTVPLCMRYFVNAKHAPPEFVAEVSGIEILRDKQYSPWEIMNIVYNSVHLTKVMVDEDRNIMVYRHIHINDLHINHVLKIHTSGDVVVGPCIPITNDPVIVNPISKIMLTNTCYGSTELK